MMRRVAGHPRSSKMREQEIIRSLASLLRDTGDSILSGRSTLSLTTSSLAILNQCFSSLNIGDLMSSFEVMPSNSARFPVFNDIHFLFDFFQKTLALKLIHGPGTLLVPITVAPFRALHSLEIKKIPLHHIQGLQSLRTRLRSLVCTRMLHSLQSLLEECGGDMSSALSWPELHTVVLSFNGLRLLDASLRLLPVLEVLDLSHNALVTTDIYLEYLTELKAVHLGFNQLSNVPIFAHTARSNLTTLMLNNNQLENIKGIGELVGLRDLRLDHNCLSDHVTLAPLRPLLRLLKLSLAGNPLSFHSNHRVLTAQHLNPTAAARVTLDGISFTQQEIQKCHRLMSSHITNGYSSSSGSSSTNLHGNSSHASLDLDFHYSESTSTTDKSTSGTSTRKRRPSRTSRRRARKAMISDLDSNEDQTSPEISQASTPVSKDVLDIKSHLEIARQQMGPDWLQAVTLQQQQQQQQQRKLRDTPSPVVAQQVTAKDNLDLNKTDSLVTTANVHSTQTLTVPNRPTNINGGKSGGRSKQLGSDLEVCRNPPSLQCSIVSSTTSDCAVDGLRLTQCDMKPQGAINSKTGNDRSKLTLDAVQTIECTNPFDTNSAAPREYVDDKNPFSDNSTNESTNPFEESSNPFEESSNPFEDSLNPFEESRASMEDSSNPFDNDDDMDVLSKSETTVPFNTYQVHPNGLLRSSKGLSGSPDGLSRSPKGLSGSPKGLSKSPKGLSRSPTGLSRSPKGLSRSPKYAENIAKTTAVDLKTVPADTTEVGQLSHQYEAVTLATENGGHVESQNEVKGDEDSMRYLEDDHEDIFLWKSNSDAVSADQDLGEELDHYIVSLHDDEQMIVTLTDRYILEKDLNGDIIEKLDLNCLESMQNIAERPLKGDGGDSEGLKKLSKPPTVRLDFSYVRKDRRKRRYIMEDSESAKSFIEHLEPILQAKNEEEQQRNLMQCLKCGAQFSSHSAPRRVRRTSMGLPVYGSSVEKGTLEEALSCPQCGSDLLISVDQTQPIPGSDASTPISSHSNTPLARSPMAGGFFKKLRQVAGGTDEMASSYQSSSSFRSAQEYFPETGGQPDNQKSPYRSPTKLRNVHSSPSLTSLERKISSDYIDSADKNDSTQVGRPRQSSDDSDICVLSHRPSLASHISEDSEISVHSNPSQSSIAVLEPEVVVEADTPSENPSYEGTPYGSLTSSTLSSMVDSIYEKSRLHQDTEDSNSTRCSNKDRSSTFNSTTTQYQSGEEEYGTPRDRTTPIPTSGNVLVRREVNAIQYWYDDFSKVDHNLRLYLDMSLFELDAEEFKLILRCSFVQFTKGEEISGLLVVSSRNFYILRFTREKSDQPPEQWIKKVQVQPLTELCYIDIGLGYQSLRLEFKNESSVFTFLIRDDHCCKTFLSQLTAVLNETSIQRASKLEGITKSNPQSLANLDVEVLLAAGDQPEAEEHGGADGAEVDATLTSYTLCYMHTGQLDAKGASVNSSVSVVVTPSHVCLAQEDHTWPVPRCSAPSNMKGPQFQLKDRQQIINITSVDTCKKEHPELTLHFHDEDTDQECSWQLILETQHTLDQLLKQVEKLWADQFGVDLPIAELPDSER